MVFMDRKISREEIKYCPICKQSMEWTSNKLDNTKYEYICKRCRIYVYIEGMTANEQEELAEIAITEQ